MNQLFYVLQINLIVFVVICNSRTHTADHFDCNSQEQDSSVCESNNEVNINSYRREADETKERSKIKHQQKTITRSTNKRKSPRRRNLKSWKIINNITEKNAETVTTTTETIENVTCKYQYNISDEEDYDARSTLIDYPFSVSIQKRGAHYVSGALIDKRWILTAAGEFYNVRESLKLFRARLGSVDCKRGGTLVPIKKVEIHPYYIHGKPNFDIALLRMAIPVDYSDVLRPIGISNIKGKVLSAKFMTTYWPRIVIKGQTLPETAKERIKYSSMRVSTQKLIPSDKCTKMLAAINEFINEASLCLKPVTTHHSVCMPDAGAPVVAEDGLWGITSGWIAPTCPDYSAPTIFTRLSSQSVRSWLDTQLLNI